MLDSFLSFFTNSPVRWDYVLGGFGMFLFGIKFMGDGLKAVAGDKIRDYIKRYTTKTYMGIFVGIIITVLVQSSSATTAITIGFIRAGLMRLEQSVGIIMGANIGTTVNSVLIGLRVDEFALIVIFIGALFSLFPKRKKMIYIGNAILGFGIMFFGVKTMGDQLKLLAQVEYFQDITMQMSKYPLLALTSGVLMTALIQSSSAMVGIVLKIYNAGGMSLEAALPFVFGANIGTTVTAILAALGGSLASKRAAGVHTAFNVVGTVIAMLLLKQFIQLDKIVTSYFHLNKMMQISFVHIVFNVLATIIIYPFVNQLVSIVRKLVKGDEVEFREVDINLDKELISTLTSAALDIAKKNIVQMGEIAIEGIDETRNYLLTGKGHAHESMMQLEGIINSMDTKITDYLLLIAQENLSNNDLEEYTTNLQVTKNIERIGDLSTNLVEFFELIFDARETLSKGAIEDILQMMDLVKNMTIRALHIYQEKDFSMHNAILEDENYLDLLEYKARQKHFNRMAASECTAQVAGSIFVDILGTIERIGDHACNISKNAINIHVTHESKTN